MKTTKEVKEIKIESVFNESRRSLVKEYIKQNSSNQSKRRLLRNELLSIQFQIEDYIALDSTNDETLKLLDFVKMYLKILNITKKEFAKYLDMQDSNLHKYLIGERKLNAKVALKISRFTHTKPEYWFGIQIKNEIIELRKEEKRNDEYEKYDYAKMLDF
ncbi:MAG: helix-turn-helix domain-containing protein [Chryseobacterium sp.]|uniref:helix-turn-helix transcriptional regulator n=1 Tax=Chryseobacterium sp. TaxID=1871047 RepID=UPI0025B99920|nr:helix-turn-helix domain-containing protein [Chryseobacterium sp.]MCJ7932493.1 helix-turn-helix domain-containing protein [Chryseobacterium sp.]